MLPAIRFLSGCRHRCQAAVFRCIRRIRFTSVSSQNEDRSPTMPRRCFFLFSSCCCSYAFALSPMILGSSGWGMSVLNPCPCRSFSLVLLRGGKDEPHAAPERSAPSAEIPASSFSTGAVPPSAVSSLLFQFSLFLFHTHYYIISYSPAQAGPVFIDMPHLHRATSFSEAGNGGNFAYGGTRRQRGQASRQ